MLPFNFNYLKLIPASWTTTLTAAVIHEWTNPLINYIIYQKKTYQLYLLIFTKKAIFISSYINLTTDLIIFFL